VKDAVAVPLEGIAIGVRQLGIAPAARLVDGKA
jgi:hypothetical protein